MAQTGASQIYEKYKNIAKRRSQVFIHKTEAIATLQYASTQTLSNIDLMQTLHWPMYFHFV